MSSYIVSKHMHIGIFMVYQFELIVGMKNICYVNVNTLTSITENWKNVHIYILRKYTRRFNQTNVNDTISILSVFRKFLT